MSPQRDRQDEAGNSNAAQLLRRTWQEGGGERTAAASSRRSLQLLLQRTSATSADIVSLELCASHVAQRRREPHIRTREYTAKYPLPAQQLRVRQSDMSRRVTKLLLTSRKRIWKSARVWLQVA
jgi:hypothetical protein